MAFEHAGKRGFITGVVTLRLIFYDADLTPRDALFFVEDQRYVEREGLIFERETVRAGGGCLRGRDGIFGGFLLIGGGRIVGAAAA